MSGRGRGKRGHPQSSGASQPGPPSYPPPPSHRPSARAPPQRSKKSELAEADVSIESCNPDWEDAEYEEYMTVQELSRHLQTFDERNEALNASETPYDGHSQWVINDCFGKAGEVKPEGHVDKWNRLKPQVIYQTVQRVFYNKKTKEEKINEYLERGIKPPPDIDEVVNHKNPKVEADGSSAKVGKGRGRTRRKQEAQLGRGVNIQSEIAMSLQTQPPPVMNCVQKQSLKEWRARADDPEHAPMWPSQLKDNEKNVKHVEVFESGVENFVLKDTSTSEETASDTFLESPNGISLETANNSLGLDCIGDLLAAPGAAVGPRVSKPQLESDKEVVHNESIPPIHTGTRKKTKWKKV